MPKTHNGRKDGFSNKWCWRNWISACRRIILVDLLDTGLHNAILDMTTNAQQQHQKQTNKMTPNKITKMFLHSRENNEFSYRIGKSICKTYISHKGLIPKICKSLKQLSGKKTSIDT